MALDPEQMMEWLAEANAENARLKKAIEYLRPEVLHAALTMEMELRNNDHKPGWKSDTARTLYNRLCEESNELANAIDDDDAEKIRKEAADVMNFAMMVADVSGSYPPLVHRSTHDIDPITFIATMASLDPDEIGRRDAATGVGGS